MHIWNFKTKLEKTDNKTPWELKKSQLGHLMSPRKFGAPSGNCGSLRKPRGSGKLARADCNSRSTFFSRGNSAAGQLLGGKEMAPRFHRKCLNSFFWQVLFCNKSSCTRLIRLFSTMSSYSPLCSSQEFELRTFISWLGDTTLTSDLIQSMFFYFAPGWHKVGDPGIRDPR